MKRFVYCVALIATLFFLNSAVQAAQPEWPTQAGRPIQCNFGFMAVATPTFVIDNVTPVDLSDYLPENTLGFEIRAASGSFIIGHADSISASPRIGRIISEGESYIWNGLAGSFTGAIVAYTANCSVVIDGAWGYGR